MVVALRQWPSAAHSVTERWALRRVLSTPGQGSLKIGDVRANAFGLIVQ